MDRENRKVNVFDKEFDELASKMNLSRLQLLQKWSEYILSNGMNRQEILKFWASGILIEGVVPGIQLHQLAQKFKPYKTEFDLIRLGPLSDGGYLVPDDLEGVEACFSPGVDDRAHFEKALFSQYNINSHLADFSVDKHPEGLNPLSFTKKFIGCHNDEKYMTMESWFEKNYFRDSKSDFILQMDIEGAEWAVLLSTPDYLLKKFRIIVIEMHWLTNWAKQCFYDHAESLIKKLSQHFTIVHVHPNNGGTLADIHGVLIPSAIEITLFRNDRFKQISENHDIPHKLDVCNNPQIKDFELPFSFR